MEALRQFFVDPFAAVRPHPGRPLRLDTRFWFNALLAYYVLLMHLADTLKPVERFSPYYFALVVPVLVFILAQWRTLWPLRDRSAVWLALFAGGAVAVSVFRADYSTAYQASVLGAVGIVVLNSRSSLSLPLVNLLFLASIPIALVTQQFLGTNAYNLIPQQGDGCLDEEPWRVSLLPLVPESAFFAVIVLVANLLYGHGRIRYFMCALAAYFAILSSMRSALLAIALIGAFLVLAWLISMRHRALFAGYFVLAAAFLVLVASSNVLYRLAPDFGSKFLNLYVYRSNAGLQSDQQLSGTVHRSAVWEYHLNLFLDNAPFGAGKYARAHVAADSAATGSHIPPAVASFAQRICRRATPNSMLPAEKSAPDGVEAPTMASDLCTACSFFTEWLARVGIIAVFPLLFLGSMVARAVAAEDRYLFSVSLVFLVVAFMWGVMVNPYNPIYLLLLGSVYLTQHLRAQSAAAARQA